MQINIETLPGWTFDFFPYLCNHSIVGSWHSQVLVYSVKNFRETGGVGVQTGLWGVSFSGRFLQISSLTFVALDRFMWEDRKARLTTKAKVNRKALQIIFIFIWKCAFFWHLRRARGDPIKKVKWLSFFSEKNKGKWRKCN